MGDRFFASIGFPICSLFFVVFIFLMYMSKKKYKNIENTLFLILLSLSFACIFSEIFYVYAISLITDDTSFANFACKIFLIFMSGWISIFISYLLALLTSKREASRKKIIRKRYFTVVGIVELIAIILITILKIDFSDNANGLYVFSGTASYVCYALGGVGIVLMIYAFVIRKDIILKSQSVIIIIAVVFVTLTLLIQFLFPVFDYNIQNFQFTLLLLALFFTLENQDSKLLKEHEDQKAVADEANRKQTEFLTSMSHEIRTPMNTIIGFSDALIREKASNEEVVREDVNNIHVAAISLLSLINNILDLSRIESNKEEAVEKEYDLSDLIVEINNNIKNILSNDEITYEIDADPSIPKKLQGDYVKINKIVTNLLSNVIHYIKKGSFRLSIQGQSNTDNEYILRFQISSNGSEVGEEEYNEHYLKDADFDNVNSEALEYNVAKKYANLLNSEIIFLSNDRYNIGYSFEIAEQVLNTNPIGDIKEFLVNDEGKLKESVIGKKVLVVDDNTINLKLIERFLLELKLNVDTLTSGSECIDRIMNTDYDLIFLDHMMPVKDGIATLAEMKNIKSNLPPVIALTANSYSGVRDYYINNGFQDYLAKPVNRGDLINLLNNYIK